MRNIAIEEILSIEIFLGFLILFISCMFFYLSSKEGKSDCILVMLISLIITPLISVLLKDYMILNILVILYCYFYTIKLLCSIIKGIVTDFKISRKYKFKDLKRDLENYETILNEKGFFTVFGKLRNYEDNTPALFFSKDNQNWYMITILRKNRFIAREFREAYSFTVIRNLSTDIMLADKNLNDENVEKIMNYSDSNFIRECYIVD